MLSYVSGINFLCFSPFYYFPSLLTFPFMVLCRFSHWYSFSCWRGSLKKMLISRFVFIKSTQSEPLTLILTIFTYIGLKRARYVNVVFFFFVHFISVNFRTSEVGFKDSKGRGGASIMQMGQFSCSMGLAWKGVRTRASKATSSNDFIPKIGKPTYI
jgi:hypothetical protein